VAAAEAEEGCALIETPCWVQGAATAAELELVHAWNVMVQLRVNAKNDDGPTAAAVATHLTELCRSFCPRRS
jgi:hypothetical protein